MPRTQERDTGHYQSFPPAPRPSGAGTGPNPPMEHRRSFTGWARRPGPGSATGRIALNARRNRRSRSASIASFTQLLRLQQSPERRG